MTDDVSPSAASRSRLRHSDSGHHHTANANATPPATTTAWASGSAISAPPGHGLRRARTVSDAANTNPSPSFASARGSTPRQSTTTSWQRASFDSSFDAPPPAEPPEPPRRSSNISDYSFSDARFILNPQREAADAQAASNHDASSPESSPLSSLAGLSLAFALLPALAGALFTNGGAVTTDIMLLGLAGVFLHWSVTQPWLWYHSAQQIRIRHEEDAIMDDMVECDSDDEESFADGVSHLDDVPEQDMPESKTADDVGPDKTKTSRQQQSALSELYLHEVAALLSCLALPLVSAYILHLIRSQLSRPSEGLVSNYNLTIFILVSEVRVLSHVIKLVQARTLHLQRIVNGNPYSTLPSTNSLRINAILERLDALESGTVMLDKDMMAEEKEEGGQGRDKDDGDDDDGDGDESGSLVSRAAQKEAAVAKEVRNAIQPELDALNRAVRRYEKKSTLLESRVDTQLAAVDLRVGDAIALAATAAKNSRSHSISISSSGSRNKGGGGVGSVLVRVFDAVVAVALFPFWATLQLFLMPVSLVLGWIMGGGSGGGKKDDVSHNSGGGGSSSSSNKRSSGDGSSNAARARSGSGQSTGRSRGGSKRAGGAIGQGRYNGDGMPLRVMRK